MPVEVATHNGEQVLVILREKWRVLIDLPDRRRQWVEPHTLKVAREDKPSKPEDIPLPNDRR
ncbi:MAG: hypothetical protein Greene041662_1018 [Candidatus Peregrinibacteria bacterium Greene0416_62]|nr:MAG: hypothetical protein Greene041662_1018 [Candidatus Peregrinibacteria bacterium Greene0416_62]